MLQGLPALNCESWLGANWQYRMAPVIESFLGRRSELLPLFREADDSLHAINSYIEQGTVFVARDTSRVIGLLQLVRGPTACEIKSLAVAPEHRRQGVGSALVRIALEQAVSLRAGRVLVATAATDIDNLRFYLRLGFRMDGVERDAFTPERGYPSMSVDGIPSRDRVWLSLDL